ncbi:MAG: DUF2264 domain-containing protein [Arachnia sp.]
MQPTARMLDWDDRRTWTDFADQMLLAVRPHASPSHAGFRFPGAPGLLGARVDALEAFARTFLLAAFRLAGDQGHDPLSVAQWYADGIEAGTDPRSPERWLRPDEHPQAKVEAASLAIALDMTRPWIWDRLPPAVQDRVVAWMAPVVGDTTYWRNNWVWFRIVVQTFLRSVGAHHSTAEIDEDLATHDSFIRANGWLTDGEGRNFDHYVGWALHLYPTLWARMQGAVDLAGPRIDADRASLQRYLDDAIRLIGADGSPLIQGRSLTYRFAAAAPFWVGALAGVDTPAPGLLRTAASRVVGHFVDAEFSHAPGVLDVGWKRPWPQLAQFYTGPGSPYWAVKGLLGVALPGTHPVWTDHAEPLPIDEADQLLAIEAPGWLVHGSRDDGILRVVNHGTDHALPASDAADSPLYARLGYSSATSPLLDDDSWANPLDNTIALLDADGRATHRTGMDRLDCRVVETPDGSLGLASSKTNAHWVDALPPTQQEAIGWPGVATPAGQLLMVSLVRGPWEIRMARVESPAPTAVQVRFGGWPLSGGSPADVQTTDGASTAAEGLTTRLTALTAHGLVGIDRRLDASPLADVTSTPFILFPVREDDWQGVLVELGATTTSGHARITTTVIGESTRFLATWPDGTTTTTQARTPRTVKGTTMPLSPAADSALTTLHQLDEQFGTRYPDDVTVDGVYPLREAQFGEPEGGNTEWTTGFVPGMFWAAGELSGDEKFFDAGRRHIPSFIDRIDRLVHVNHHDLGFLYTLSCVTAWRHDGNEEARDAALAAADQLMGRVVPSIGIIQSWGELDDPEQAGRAIIDSLMNMPLLYWATEVTGDQRYADAARLHAQLLGKSIVRDDDTTHHTFHWDVTSGAPLFGTTAQGHADDSTWARGQAWGIYGFALNHAHTGDPELLAVSERCARRFLDLLPEDNVPFWDMVFTDGSDEPRDSSAGAIAVCGLNDLAAITGKTEYQEAADRILDSLEANYATTAEGPENCLLLHGVYAKHGGRGIDEGNLWGDYYYMEALLRRHNPDWVSYWAPSA